MSLTRTQIILVACLSFFPLSALAEVSERGECYLFNCEGKISRKHEDTKLSEFDFHYNEETLTKRNDKAYFTNKVPKGDGCTEDYPIDSHNCEVDANKDQEFNCECLVKRKTVKNGKVIKATKELYSRPAVVRGSCHHNSSYSSRDYLLKGKVQGRIVTIANCRAPDTGDEE